MKNTALTLLSLLLPFIIAGTAEAQLINGNFETGDFTGWTEFNTANGGTLLYQVSQFDTAGTGTPSSAAEFQVGEVRGVIGVGGLGEGAGIYQYVSLNAGQLNISLDVAAASEAANVDAGTFELLVDGNVVASNPLGGIGISQTIIRSTLDYSGTITAGTHQIAVDIRRGYAYGSSTPVEYLDNITLTGTAVPEPSAALLFSMAGVFLIPIKAIAKRRSLGES